MTMLVFSYETIVRSEHKASTAIFPETSIVNNLRIVSPLNPPRTTGYYTAHNDQFNITTIKIEIKGDNFNLKLRLDIYQSDIIL